MWQNVVLSKQKLNGQPCAWYVDRHSYWPMWNEFWLARYIVIYLSILNGQFAYNKQKSLGIEEKNILSNNGKINVGSVKQNLKIIYFLLLLSFLIKLLSGTIYWKFQILIW